MRFNKAVAMPFLMLAIACGGGSNGGDNGSGGSGSSGGEGVQTSGGAVSVEAHNHWTEGLEAYNAAEEGEWNEQTCSSVIDSFEEAVDAQGNFAEAHYMLGQTHERCGDASEARSDYNRALQSAEAGLRELRREDPEARPPANGPLCKARVAVGLLDLAGGNASGARNAFQQAVQDDAQCTSGYVNLAIQQRAVGGEQEEEALRNLRRALAIESDYLPAFNQMALLYYTRGLDRTQRASLDLAEIVCRQAQLIDGNYAEIYNTWGLVKIKKGNVIEALRFFERAIALDDSMFEAQMNFAQITISFRGYQDAQRAFGRAAELRPESYEAHIGLGAAHRGLRNFDGAKAEYERAIEIDANRPEAYFNLGVLYHDYISAQQENMAGTITELERAKGFYEQFVAKASGNAAFTEDVENVRRSCRENSERARRRTGRQYRGGCRPGRIQIVDNTVAALREAEQMQREAEQMQREMEAEAAAMQAAEQQAAEAAPAEGEGDAAPAEGEAAPAEGEAAPE